MKWISIPAALMAAVSFYVGFYYLWMYARRRSEAENLSFAITCFSIALYDVFCAGLYNASTVEQGIYWQRLQFAILAIFSISVSWFMYHLTRYRTPRPFIAISAWLMIFFIAGLVIQNEWTLSAARPLPKKLSIGGFRIVYNEADPGIIYHVQYFSMMLVAVFLLYLLVQEYRSDENPRIRPILVSMVPLFAAGVNDVLIGADVYSFIYLLEYAYMFVLLSMAHVLQNRFIGLRDEVEELTHQLEEKINDRTMELFFSEITRGLYAEISGEAAPVGGSRGGEEGRPSTISTLSQDISIIMNIDKLLTRSLEKSAGIAGADRAFLYMINDDGTLELSAYTGNALPPAWIPETAERVLWEHQHFVQNIHDYEGNSAAGAAVSGGVFNSIFLPVSLRGRAIGVCCMQRPGPSGAFTDKDSRLISAFIAQASSAIENAYLYQRMIDRNSPAREHSITPNIEEKMKKALAYIRQNFTADISREGLAASLNLHPDSFGRFFKIYTNKKISEYINELRVMEAAGRIRETDSNIIDIAFSVGFESLPTFNRAFLKVMKTTPTKYRERGS